MKLINKKAKFSKSHKTINNPKKVSAILSKFVIRRKGFPIRSGNMTIYVNCRDTDQWEDQW